MIKHYFGVVEDRNDPMKLGRCQVRVAGLHTHDKSVLRTEDLPWAIPLQPINSAGVNGIGRAPVGPVEGTLVRIEFLDEDCQIPIMTGVVGSIPQGLSSVYDTSDTTVFRSEADDIVAAMEDTLNEEPSASPVENIAETATEALTEALNPAQRYTNISKEMESFIKGFESFEATAYQDSAGVWTIGWGSTRINGTPVVPGQKITREQADKAFTEHLQREVIPYIHRSCRALITQSMFDALCSLCYNIGGPSLTNSTLMVELNSSRYMNAASRFGEWRKSGGRVVQGLVTRRAAEKNFFLKEGVPNDVGGITPVEQPSLEDSPQVAAQNQDLTTHGFKDPNGKYPAYVEEADTSRLARGEEIHKTTVYKKETARIKDIPIAGMKDEDGNAVTWEQPPNPYNAQYPYNHVTQTESGHLLEFDDTPNSERVHIYHRAGSFIEWDANGTQVNRIVGDNYEILERNGFIYINGNANVTVNGNTNVKINSALNVDVSGPCNINVFNDANLNVSGNLNTSVAGDFNLRANSINLETTGGDFNVKSASNANVESSGSANIKAGGNFNADGSRIDLNNGAASGANGTGLGDPAGKQEPANPTFPELTVITRASNAAGYYETPDEGDATAYRKELLDRGVITQEEHDYEGEEKETAVAEETNVELVPASCDIIYSMEKFSPSLQLTKRVTLGMLTKGGSRKPRAVRGLTAQEIVCNLKCLAENCIDKVFEMYPNSIITSGLRIDGNPRSQHNVGQAVDIVLNGFSRREHYEAIQEIQKAIPFDQLILETSGSRTVWIHISYKSSGNRKQTFTMHNHRRVSSFGQFKLIT